MKKARKSPLALLGAVLAGAVMSATPAIAQDVTPERLINSEKEPGNWLNHHGNLEAHRYSGLDQITTKNVKDADMEAESLL